MGCFLSCFRSEPDESVNLRDPLVRESRLGDAFLNDEKKSEETATLDAAAEANGAEVDEELELRREANYLKSCGTISQTPPEILEALIPINSEDTNECNDILTKMQRMKHTPLNEENLSELLNSDKDDTLSHEQNIDEGTPRVEPEPQASLQDKPFCLNVGDHIIDSSHSTLIEENLSEVVNSDKSDTSSQEQNIDEGTPRVEPDSQSSLPDRHLCLNVRDHITDPSDSPYPTPLVIRGDIQTPGTVYTSYKESSKPGKRSRASRQFIYPVLRPIENKLQWMEAKAESPVLSSNPPKRRNLSADPTKKAQQICAGSAVTKTESSEPEPFPFYDSFAAQDEVVSPDEPKGQNDNQQLHESGELSKQSSEDKNHGASSLSYWLKPSSADDESNSDPVGKESILDVPIFPALGFTWGSDSPTPVLRKAWDGNGIPNTTTKYKEDQRVNWHATPFEERLLKVLSDEKPRLERKISGKKLIHLEENAE
ncbi:hypothetical protein BS78_04G050200 [Paspalum vaginatum]|nr:hypothetical protein BS78_04G050200 [Paspalum vaginatum]